MIYREYIHPLKGLLREIKMEHMKIDFMPPYGVIWFVYYLRKRIPLKKLKRV